MRPDRFVRLCISEAFRGLVGHRRSAAPAIAIIAVSLIVLGGFLMVSENLGGILGRWRARGHVQLFLERDADETELQAIEQRLAGAEAVEAYRYVSPEEAARQFRDDFAELGELLAFLEENPLPPAYVITVRPAYRLEAQLADLATSWEALAGVEAAQYDLQIIRRLELGVNALRFAGGLLGGAVLLAAIITTANVIRVLVVERRREITVLRMVGATESVVRGRFLAEGGIQGLLGSILALIALYGAYKVGVAYVGAAGGPLRNLIPLRFLDVGFFATLIGSGVAAGVVGAWLAFGSSADVER